MALERVTRDLGDDGRCILLCGWPDCSNTAHAIIEFEWNRWAGVIGACDEHREDLDVLRIRAREAEGRL